MDNQGTNEDDSQSDPHLEAGLFRSQTTQNSAPEVGPYMVTGATERHDMVTGVTEEVRNGPDIVTRVQKESICSHDMVTGGPEEIGFRPHMVTGVHEEICQYSHMTTETQEEIRYCSPSTSSGKQKKALSTSQPQFRSENTTATIEADQILLPFNNWRQTVIQATSTTTSVESRSCLNPSQQQCPHLMEKQRNLNCLKIYSKRV